MLGPLVFFAVKLAVYTAWMRAGLARIEPPLLHQEKWRAPAWAAARLALGFVVGSALLWLFSLAPNATHNRIGIPELFGSWAVTYVLVYGPLRLAEWALFSRFMAGAGHRMTRAPRWIAGGTGLSFLTDVLGFAAAFTAVGGIC